jgi:hypothetical protein
LDYLWAVVYFSQNFRTPPPLAPGDYVRYRARVFDSGSGPKWSVRNPGGENKWVYGKVKHITFNAVQGMWLIHSDGYFEDWRRTREPDLELNKLWELSGASTDLSKNFERTEPNGTKYIFQKWLDLDLDTKRLDMAQKVDPSDRDMTLPGYHFKLLHPFDKADTGVVEQAVPVRPAAKKRARKAAVTQPVAAAAAAAVDGGATLAAPVATAEGGQPALAPRPAPAKKPKKAKAVWVPPQMAPPRGAAAKPALLMTGMVYGEEMADVPMVDIKGPNAVAEAEDQQKVEAELGDLKWVDGPPVEDPSVSGWTEEACCKVPSMGEKMKSSKCVPTQVFHTDYRAD